MENLFVITGRTYLYDVSPVSSVAFYVQRRVPGIFQLLLGLNLSSRTQ